MIFAFITVLILLLVLGAYLSRFRRAALHWGRQIAELAQVLPELNDAIDAAKGSGDYGKAAELQLRGSSVRLRGFQDAITPRWVTRLTLLQWALCLGTFAWGFFVLPWYIAVFWPVPFGIIKRSLGSVLPPPHSQFYRQKLISSLESRCRQFRRTGDNIRLAAGEYMIGLLRSEENV